MEFFLHYFLPFAVALTILVFIHEMGHYLPARKFGIKVEVFSIGFGPEIFGWTGKNGTRWKFSLIPLGGYVRMFGDANEASAPDSSAKERMHSAEFSQTLQSKSPLQKIIVSVGGPLANFIFAIAAMSIIFAIYGVGTIPSKIAEVKEHSLATKMGLRAGDEIVAFNDVPVKDFAHLREHTRDFSGTTLTLSVKSAGEERIRELTLTHKEGFSKPLIFGIVPAEPMYHPIPKVQAIPEALKATYQMSLAILHSLGQLFQGKSNASDMGGILAIGDMAGKSAQASLVSFVMFLAVLSVNLGLLNLLPFPMLDGGAIVFSVIEGVVGRPVPLRVQEKIYFVGFIFLVSVMLYVTWNDLIRYKVFKSISTLFSSFF